MNNIFGAGDSCPVWVCYLVAVCMVAIVICMVIMTFKTMSGFENMPDYGIGQRGDVVASVPAYEETSLRQKVDQWTKPVMASQLTGSRDVPVFFSDIEVESGAQAGRNTSTSAVSSAREGFEGGRREDELERALAGRN